MIRDDHHFDGLLRAIYAAGADPKLWSDAMRRIGAVFGTDQAQFMLWDLPTGRASWLDYVGFGEVDLAAYYHYLDRERLMARATALPRGTIYTDATLGSPEEIARSAFYNEFRLGVGTYWMISTMMAMGPNTVAFPAILRPKDAPPFDRDDMRRYALFLPHIANAHRVQFALESIEGARVSSIAALDRLARAAVLCDSIGRVVHANRAARAIADQNDGIILCARGVSASDPSAASSLSLALASAAAGKGTALRLPRPSGRPSLAVIVAPIGEAHPLSGGSPMVGIFLADPAAGPKLSAETAACYRLTPAEAALFAALISGASLDAAANQRGISLATAKTQLQSIFDKTGVRRQTDLVRVALGNAGTVDGL